MYSIVGEITSASPKNIKGFFLFFVFRLNIFFVYLSKII